MLVLWVSGAWVVSDGVCQLSSVSRREKASPRGLFVATRTRFLGESSGLKMGRSSAWKPGRKAGLLRKKPPTLSASLPSLWAQPRSPRGGLRVSKETQFSTRNTGAHCRFSMPKVLAENAAQGWESNSVGICTDPSPTPPVTGWRITTGRNPGCLASVGAGGLEEPQDSSPTHPGPHYRPPSPCS